MEKGLGSPSKPSVNEKKILRCRNVVKVFAGALRDIKKKVRVDLKYLFDFNSVEGGCGDEM